MVPSDANNKANTASDSISHCDNPTGWLSNTLLRCWMLEGFSTLFPTVREVNEESSFNPRGINLWDLWCASLPCQAWNDSASVHRVSSKNTAGSFASVSTLRP